MQRKTHIVEEKEVGNLEEEVKKDDSDEESAAKSEGSFLSDTDDEELVGTCNVKEVSPSAKKNSENESFSENVLTEKILETAMVKKWIRLLWWCLLQTRTGRAIRMM